MRNPRILLLAGACVLALSACGDKSPPPAEPAATPPAATDPAPAESPAPMPEAPAPAPAPAADGKPAAVVADCATQIEGNDAMQFNVSSITIPASCTDFKITLKHTGTMPIAAMGHNVVISKASEMMAVAAEGMGAGAANSYVKAGDARVVAFSKLVGGGETTSVSFPVSKLKDGGPYEFFCSFPGHAAMMKGSIKVE
ncbi:MAG: azurin [Lysobacteraceae bacterium]|nr:MAG: azurin [Xanthomonadaceae bacterium]